MRLPFFVYGTLRPGEGNYGYCLAGKTRQETPGTLSGSQMYGNLGFPYVILSDNPADTVRGDLVWVDESVASYEDVKHSLDALEGTRIEGRNTGNHYDRLVADIQTDDGAIVRAWVYIANLNITQALLDQEDRVPPRIVSGDWVAHTQEGRRKRYEETLRAHPSFSGSSR